MHRVDDRGRVHDASTPLIPYLAGFALCVGAVFALVACTTPAAGVDHDRDGGNDSATSVVEEPAG
jgi:hypothetical protein